MGMWNDCFYDEFCKRMNPSSDDALANGDFGADFKKAFKSARVNTYTPVPAGVYAIKIDNAAIVKNKTGASGTHIDITAVILAKIENDGGSEKCVRKYAGRKIFEHWAHGFDDMNDKKRQSAVKMGSWNVKRLWYVTGHPFDTIPSNVREMIGLIAYAYVGVKNDNNGYPPCNVIKPASFAKIPDYMRRRLQADTFIDRQIDILKETLKIDFQVSSQYSDMQEVTDLIGKRANGLEVRVSLRTDTNESHRVNGIFRLRESEIPKIENGHGDYMLVCYVKGDEVLDWKLLKLEILQNIARGTLGGLRVLGEPHSNDNGSYYTFRAMDIHPELIIADSSAPQNESPFTAPDDYSQPWKM